MPLDVFEDVEQRRRRGRLVAVHLRPQQHAGRPRANRDVIDRPPLERLADLLEREQPRRRGHDLVQPLHDLCMIEQRRQRRRHMFGVPNPRQLRRRNGRLLRPSDGPCEGQRQHQAQAEGQRESCQVHGVLIAGTRDPGPGRPGAGLGTRDQKLGTGTARGPNRQLRTLRAGNGISDNPSAGNYGSEPGTLPTAQHSAPVPARVPGPK